MFIILAELTCVASNFGHPAPSPPRKPINTLKWRKDPQFVGREDTLESIKIIFEEYGCAALTGAGGIGYVFRGCGKYY